MLSLKEAVDSSGSSLRRDSTSAYTQGDQSQTTREHHTRTRRLHRRDYLHDRIEDPAVTRASNVSGNGNEGIPRRAGKLEAQFLCARGQKDRARTAAIGAEVAAAAGLGADLGLLIVDPWSVVKQTERKRLRSGEISLSTTARRRGMDEPVEKGDNPAFSGQNSVRRGPPLLHLIL